MYCTRIDVFIYILGIDDQFHIHKYFILFYFSKFISSDFIGF